MSILDTDNRELQRTIAYFAKKMDFKDVTKEDLLKIKTFSITFLTLALQKSDIELDILEELPNIETLHVRSYIIDQDELKKIMKLKKLKKLSFSNCYFMYVDFDVFFKPMISISFDHCDKLVFKYPLVSDIIADCCEVDFESIDFSFVHTVRIINGKINNVHEDLLEKYPNITRIEIDGTELYDIHGKLVKDLKVSKNTYYTHKEEWFPVNGLT